MTKKFYYPLFTTLFLGAALFLASSCEGPAGPAGKDGVSGVDGLAGLAGKDANENCKKCHTPAVVEAKATQYELSKHSFGETAKAEAGGSTGCTPCHESEAFKFVCANNTPATFVKNSTTGKFSNSYVATVTTGFGEFTCNTCHSSLHKTYEVADFYPLTTTAAVPMTMWAGAKTINLTQDDGKSNLCVKCHQPRPITRLFDGNVVDYASLATAGPTDIAYSSTNTAKDSVGMNLVTPSYRTHVHYGAVGAIVAGVGGVEFGTGYLSSKHATVASCVDCHMADMTNAAGGHSFVAKGNFNGCNVSGCHSDAPISSSSASWTTTRNSTKALLNSLATKLIIGGIEILNKNPDATANLWAGLTAGNYDGYLNVYDPINNPTAVINNGGAAKQFKNMGNTSSWNSDQITYNNTLTPIFLTKIQLGAIINFQLCLRESSLGIHNTKYSTALLTNSIAALP